MQEANQFVFVGGYMHSGTTLLGQVVGNLPGAAFLGRETKFLEFLARYRTRFPDLGDETQRAELRSLCLGLLVDGFDFTLLAGGAGRPAQPSKVRDYIEVFLDAATQYLDERDTSILVEHTGTNIFAYHELAQIPNAYLIDIVRDPRDVLASKKVRRQTVFTDRYTAEQQRRKHFEKSFDPVWDTISWRSFVRAGVHAEAAMSERYLRVRYEDLVVDPGGELDRVAVLLGLSRSDRALAVEVNNPADPSRRRAGIDASSVGQWRNVLSPGEAATCEWLARREADLVGMSDANPRLRPSMVLPAARAAKEPVVRVYRRTRLGGVHGARALVANYVTRLRRGSAS